MSSSLDDLEPYEIFQNELDAYLKEYEKSVYNTATDANHFYMIHTFIEYICFIRSKSALNKITAEEINIDFVNFIMNKFEGEIQFKEILSPVYSYLKFIFNQNGKPTNDLLNSIKF